MRNSKTQGLGAAKVVKTAEATSCFSIKVLLFLNDGTERCHSSQSFYSGQYFISSSERIFRFLFLWFGRGTSCRERGTAKPKCRCSTWQALHRVSWPDKRRERNTAIYLYSLWFCVLRPRLPDPGWILSKDEDRRIAFHRHTKRNCQD